MHYIPPPESVSLLQMQHLLRRVSYCGGKLVARNLKLPISMEGVLLSSSFCGEWFLFVRFEELFSPSSRNTSGVAPGLGGDRGLSVSGTCLARCFFDLLVVLIGMSAS